MFSIKNIGSYIEWKRLLLIIAFGFLLFPNLRSSLFVNFGNIYLYRNDLSNAEKFFLLSSTGYNKVPGIKGLGLVLLRNRDYESALDAFDIVLTYSESDLFSRLARAEIKSRLGDQEGANQDWLLTSPKAVERLGTAAIDAQDWDKAENFFRLKIELQPEDSNGYFLLGFALQKQGLNDAALDVWRQGLAISPDNEMILLRYGQLKHTLGDYQNSIALFSKYIEVNHTNFMGWYWRGLSYKV
jgi:tetratricopeptide (TPR) repeat protein